MRGDQPHLSRKAIESIYFAQANYLMESLTEKIVNYFYVKQIALEQKIYIIVSFSRETVEFFFLLRINKQREPYSGGWVDYNREIVDILLW